MSKYHSLLRLFVLTCGMLVPLEAHAFKLDTHLWIGQQVLNDLADDGAISVVLGGRSLRLDVPADVTSAILAHRNEYLLGHLGPDAIPDVVVGQTLVHPGTPQGWKTNDWLRFLLDKSRGNALGTAFAYGYLGHAAADVFAHTYVNQYAGDIFDLTDELLVEQRHAALESYIARLNPPFLGAAGEPLGAPWRLVLPGDDFANFVRDTLIYEPNAAAQHAASPTSSHLAAYRAYREVIRGASELQIWREIDNAVLRGVAAYYDIALNPEQAAILVDFLNEQVIPHVQQRIDLTQAHIDRLNAAVDRFDAKHYEALHGALRRVSDLHSAIATRVAARAEASGKLCRTVAESVCRQDICCAASFAGHCIAHNPICPPTCFLAERIQCPISEAVGNASAALIRQIDSELNGRDGLFDQLLASATQLREQALVAKNGGLDLAQRLTDLGQVMSSDTSPVRAALASWTRDLDAAMSAYVKAATATMINTMNPGARDLPYRSITPMVEWWDCYHLTMAGLPAAVGTGTCGFRGSVERTWAALDNIAHVVEDVALLGPSQATGLPTPTQVRAEIERLKERATRQLIDAGIDALTDLLPSDVQDFIEVLSEDMTDERLRYYFTKPETRGAKGLLMIGDIDARIRKEMFLEPGDASYDAERYAVIYDSVLLAKLALLDQAGLQRLAAQANVARRSDGADLFAGTPNVLVDAVASIDGNHQWMSDAPPRPSAAAGNFRDVALPPGYPQRKGYAAAAGFVPFLPEARSALFRELFIGPLSPGIELPSELGLREILPADYPYRPCLAFPFPDDEFDHRCTAEFGVVPGPGPSTSSLRLEASAASALAGSSVTLTATVTGDSPAGSVMFFDNGAPLDSAPLIASVARLTSAPLAGGVHNFSATYQGDGVNLASTAAPVAVRALSPPRADAGADRAVFVSTAITLTGVATDPDGGALTYVWRQLSGPTVALRGADTLTVSLTAPATAGTQLTLELTVTDDAGLSASDTVVITPRPPLRLLPDECPRARPGTRCVPR